VRMTAASTSTAPTERAAANKAVAMAVVSDIKAAANRKLPVVSAGGGGGGPLHPVQTSGAPDRPAAIQVLTGALVGKEFPLVNTATTMGKTGKEVAIISRTNQGYFITHLEGPKFPIVNGATIESRARRLGHRDVIEVAGVKIVFFYK